MCLDIRTHFLNSLRIAHVDPTYPLLQVQTFGLVHLPWIHRLLQIAKIYNDITLKINSEKIIP